MVNRLYPVCQKEVLCDTSAKNRGIGGIYAGASMEGWRVGMEDTHILEDMGDYILMGVFDGHGGDTCSQFCRDHFVRILVDEVTKFKDENSIMSIEPEHFRIILKTTIYRLDNEFKDSIIQSGTDIEYYEVGSTLVIAIIMENNIIIANVGDSRAIIVDKSDGNLLFRTNDHNATSAIDMQRIKESGYFVREERIFGCSLNVFRSIGDYVYKHNTKLTNSNVTLTPEQYCVTCEPEIDVIERKNGCYVMLSCDGIWEHLDMTQVIEHIMGKRGLINNKKFDFGDGHLCTANEHNEHAENKHSTEHSHSCEVESLCEHLLNLALDSGSRDNMSIIIYEC